MFRSFPLSMIIPMYTHNHNTFSLLPDHPFFIVNSQFSLVLDYACYNSNKYVYLVPGYLYGCLKLQSRVFPCSWLYFLAVCNYNLEVISIIIIPMSTYNQNLYFLFFLTIPLTVVNTIWSFLWTLNIPMTVSLIKIFLFPWFFLYLLIINFYSPLSWLSHSLYRQYAHYLYSFVPDHPYGCL